MTTSPELQTRIEILIKDSDLLISQEFISEKTFTDYNNKVHLILSEIIKSDFNKSIKANAIKALRPISVKWKSKFFLFNWIHYFLISKLAYNFYMPFLIGNSETDNYKTQIQNIKMHLEAIKFKLKS